MGVDVSRETVRLTPQIHRQIKAVQSGYRRRVHHGGKLCSHCLKNPPTHRPYCDFCRASYARLRKRFAGADFKREWARDAREKQQRAGQG